MDSSSATSPIEWELIDEIDEASMTSSHVEQQGERPRGQSGEKEKEKEEKDEEANKSSEEIAAVEGREAEKGKQEEEEQEEEKKEKEKKEKNEEEKKEEKKEEEKKEEEKKEEEKKEDEKPKSKDPITTSTPSTSSSPSSSLTSPSSTIASSSTTSSSASSSSSSSASSTSASSTSTPLKNGLSLLDSLLDATGKAALSFFSKGNRHKLIVPVLLAVFATGLCMGCGMASVKPPAEPLKVYLETRGEIPKGFLDQFEKQVNHELSLLRHPGVNLIPYVESKIDWTNTCLLLMVEVGDNAKQLDQAVKTRTEELSKKTGGNSLLAVVYKSGAVAEVNTNKAPSSLSAHGARSSFHLELRRSEGQYDQKKNSPEARKFASNFASIKTGGRPL